MCHHMISLYFYRFWRLCTLQIWKSHASLSLLRLALKRPSFIILTERFSFDTICLFCRWKELDSCVKCYLPLLSAQFSCSIDLYGLAYIWDMIIFGSEATLKKSFLTDSCYLRVALFGDSCVLINKMTKKPLFYDSVHNFIYLSALLNNFGLFDFVVAYIDVASIIVHRDIVNCLWVNLRSSLA